jgi:hypothetical protein
MIAVGLHNSGKSGKCAVVQFHVDAVKCFKDRRHFDEMQDHRLVRTKNFS